MWQATNKGNISGIIGPVDINFLMLPKTNINLKLSSKKKVQVSWNQKSKGIKIQIFYSTKKNKGYKKAATINSSKGKATVKKLKSKKKYYFKVRCSKTVKGHTYYSAYSKIKSIKITLKQTRACFKHPPERTKITQQFTSPLPLWYSIIV